MSESENASTSDESVWDYIEQNPKIIGLPITDTKGIDLLSALRDVYIHTKKDPKVGNIVTSSGPFSNFVIVKAFYPLLLYFSI